MLQGYWDGYDPTVNPGILASFAAAAFRFGHTLLPTNVERWSKQHRYITHTPLSDLIRQPFDLYEPGVFDEYFLGMTNQPALAFDDFVTAEVTTMLFRKIGERHGVDLTAFNLQRNREVGLPGYTTFRKFCGHSPINTWEDLLGSMSNDTVYRFASVLRCGSLPSITFYLNENLETHFRLLRSDRLTTSTCGRAAWRRERCLAVCWAPLTPASSPPSSAT